MTLAVKGLKSTIEHKSILKTNKNSLLTKNKKRKFADFDFQLKI